MKKFQFNALSEETVTSLPFFGYAFYEVYKNALFLQDSDNINTILTKGHQLRLMLKNMAPGEKVVVSGMQLTKTAPLIITKSNPRIPVGSLEFTTNRLTGLTAAFVFEHRRRFPTLATSESSLLGLSWNQSDVEASRLFLSAVSGSEHFYDHFAFFPLVCALKKLELKKNTIALVVKIAKIKNSKGIPMGVDMMNHRPTTIKLWDKFTAKSDFRRMIKELPHELKQLLNSANNK